ncbi:hypothetical protein BH20CHL5_BH20CHL5_09950 [soil metagenome]|jgi:hypothetical protein
MMQQSRLGRIVIIVITLLVLVAFTTMMFQFPIGS